MYEEHKRKKEEKIKQAVLAEKERRERIERREEELERIHKAAMSMSGITMPATVRGRPAASVAGTGVTHSFGSTRMMTLGEDPESVVVDTIKSMMTCYQPLSQTMFSVERNMERLCTEVVIYRATRADHTLIVTIDLSDYILSGHSPYQIAAEVVGLIQNINQGEFDRKDLKGTIEVSL
jgi:hypothetical protein